MITPEITCTVKWVALMVDHHCEQPHGHSGPHECACGAMSVDQVTVARMAAALADIADRHQPDLMSSTETLRCDWCSQQAGIPVPWPCMDRGAIGDLLPLPHNRLLPP
jgi:hypothetical protein